MSAPDEARRHTSGGGIAIIARRSLFTPIKLAHTLLPGQARDGGPGRYRKREQYFVEENP